MFEDVEHWNHVEYPVGNMDPDYEDVK